MGEDSIWNSPFRASLQRIWRILMTIGLIALVPAILLYVFGFSIKGTPEYRCAMRLAEESEPVLSVTGSPVQPGLFAWTKFFESGGMVRQGAFFTSLSGPKGRGRMDVSFYRSPVGDSLAVWFTSHGEEIEVHNSTYPCEE